MFLRKEAMQVLSIFPLNENGKLRDEFALAERLYQATLAVRVLILLVVTTTGISPNGLSVFSPRLLPFKQLPLRCLAK